MTFDLDLPPATLEDAHCLLASLRERNESLRRAAESLASELKIHGYLIERALEGVENSLPPPAGGARSAIAVRQDPPPAGGARSAIAVRQDPPPAGGARSAVAVRQDDREAA